MTQLRKTEVSPLGSHQKGMNTYPIISNEISLAQVRINLLLIRLDLYLIEVDCSSGSCIGVRAEQLRLVYSQWVDRQRHTI